ncbi:aldehyde ferredoxin oxidoreductase N-terminal domain-containing protein [Chloroflexota bacterium]
MTGQFGYAGKILRADLSLARMTDVPTADYADRFIGGRGIGAKIYWDEVPPEVKALDPENRLIITNGPMAGYPGIAGSMWQICGRSPASNPEHFFYGVLGGSLGAYLKFAGYDGIIVQGKSEKPVYLLIGDGTAELRDASSLQGKGCVEVRSRLIDELGSSVRVLATGPAGENMVSFATALATDDAACCGLAAVMGSKNLKAVAILGGGHRPKAAHPERLRELARHIRKLRPDGPAIFHKWMLIPAKAERVKSQLCYSCPSGCQREIYEAADGDKGKFCCHAGAFYIRYAIGYYGERNDVPFYATRLCNKYGLDTYVVDTMINWLSQCYQGGILTDENTGIPLSKLGSREFIEVLVRKISLREGFGDILARGLYQAADSVGSKSRDLITDYADKNGQYAAESPRLCITHGLIQATEPREPIAEQHNIARPILKWMVWFNRMVEGAYMSGDVLRAIGKRFWHHELALDFSTGEGKAISAKRIQDRIHAIESLVFCTQVFPLTDTEHSEDYVGDPTLESSLYSAVTDRETSEEGLNQAGERIFNLQRAILMREGYGGKRDDQIPEFNYTLPLETSLFNEQCQVPGKDGELISRKGATADRIEFNQTLDEYYRLRGWDKDSGWQTKAKLKELDLGAVAADLEHRGLIK